MQLETYEKAKILQDEIVNIKVLIGIFDKGISDNRFTLTLTSTQEKERGYIDYTDKVKELDVDEMKVFKEFYQTKLEQLEKEFKEL